MGNLSWVLFSLRNEPGASWKGVSGTAAIVLLALTWEAGARALAWLGAPQIFFPPLSTVLRAGWEMACTSAFWYSTLVSNLRVLAGFLVAAAVAIPMGIAFGSYPRLEGLLSPMTDFGRYLPVPALVPVSIIWAGVGDLQKVLVLAIGTFFHVLVMTTDAVRRVPQMHVDSARTLGATEFRTILRVLIPSSLPQIFDACRVGIALTWSYLLVAEIVASQAGLGAIIIKGQRYLRTDQMFFVILVLGLLGLLYDRMFTVLRPRLFQWVEQGRAHGV